MRIYHPSHLTAGSLRQQGAPLLFLDGEGRELSRDSATKAECFLEVPEGVKYMLHLYITGSGRVEPALYNVIPDRGNYAFERLDQELPAWVEEHVRQFLIQRGW